MQRTPFQNNDAHLAKYGSYKGIRTRHSFRDSRRHEVLIRSGSTHSTTHVMRQPGGQPEVVAIDEVNDDRRRPRGVRAVEDIRSPMSSMSVEKYVTSQRGVRHLRARRVLRTFPDSNGP